MDIRFSTPVRARLVWLSPSPAAFHAARAVFSAAGYLLVQSTEDVAADMIVVDLRERQATSKAASELAVNARRRASPDCSIVYIAASTLGDADRAHLRRSGELVVADDDISAVVAACRNRLRIRNIAEETGERLKSIAASTRLSEFPSIETSSAPPSILIAGPPGSAMAGVLYASEAAAESVTAVFNAAQAMRALEAGAFDCAIFAPNSEGDPLIALSRSMRRHRKHQDLPIIVVAPHDYSRSKFAAAAASDYFSSEIVDADLFKRVLTLVRRARLISAMRRFLNACAGEGVRDRVSGVFTHQFFAAHAERVFERAAQTARTASLVGIRLAPPANEAEAVSSVRTLTDAARLIGRVTRAEDCAARISSDTFAILLSSTNANDAAAAARRIEGVIANAMFRLRGERRLLAVAAATAAVEHAPGRRFEETLASVLLQLNAVSPKTAER